MTQQVRTPAPDEVDLVIYHGHCFDGFTSAWCAWLRRGNDCEYVPGIYGEPPPIVAGRNVAIVDFSYKRPVLEELAAQADSLIILDHHKTAQADLEGLPYAIFDMERSGAGITADWFEIEKHAGSKDVAGYAARRLVDYVQDRDLWRWALPDSREISEALKLVDYDFEAWSRFAMDLQECRGEIVAQGKALLRSTEQHLNRLAETAAVGNIAGTPCWFACAPYGFASELGNVLAERGDPAVAAVWRCDYSLGRLGVSLRASAASTVDVSELAKRFGGGGHKKAAGFELPLVRVKELAMRDVWVKVMEGT